MTPKKKTFLIFFAILILFSGCVPAAYSPSAPTPQPSPAPSAKPYTAPPAETYTAPSPPPPVSPEAPVIPEKFPVREDTVPGKDFNAAENFYVAGDYDKALPAYKDFVSKYPKDANTDNALFRIGEILFSQERYSEALQYYQRILDNFLTSEIYTESEYKIGLCYYHLRLFEKSTAVLLKILPQFSDSERKARIRLYIARGYAEQGKFLQAVTEHKKLLSITKTESLAGESRREVIRIIPLMNMATVEELLQRYPEEFPAGYARFQLGKLYYQSRNYSEAKEIFNSFLVAFPGHEYSERAREYLSTVETPTIADQTKIGVVLPLSGKGAMAGQKILHGIQLSFSNLELTQQKSRFQLVIKDSASDARRAAEAVAELAIEDKVIGIIGPFFSSSAREAGQVADRYRIPLFSPFAHARGITEQSSYVFRNSLTNEMQGKAITEYAYYKLSLRTFAILYPNNAYGQELKDIFITNVLRLGGEIKHVVSYDTKENDFSKEIKQIGGLGDEEFAKLKKEMETTGEPLAPVTPLPAPPPVGAEEEVKPPNPNPHVDYEALFIPGYYDKVGLIAPALPFYNISQITLLGANGWNSPKIISIGEKYVEGAVFVDGFFINSPLFYVKEFVKNYRETFGEDPDILAAQAYDVTEIMLKALSETGTREGLREALLRVRNFPGVSGTTSMTFSGDSEKALFFLTIRNGKIVQID